MMLCPNCNHEIPESLLKKWWASLGGKVSKRKITPEQQAQMQEARKRKKASRPNDQHKRLLENEEITDENR